MPVFHIVICCSVFPLLLVKFVNTFLSGCCYSSVTACAVVGHASVRLF